MKRTLLLGAVTLGLILAAPTVSLGAPNKGAVKRTKKTKKAGKTRKVKKALKASKAAKKPGQSYNFGPMDVTAGPEAPQAAYLIPRARVKYTPPSHEKELLTWIMRSMRHR
jgi:hypothetical protein